MGFKHGTMYTINSQCVGDVIVVKIDDNKLSFPLFQNKKLLGKLGDFTVVNREWMGKFCIKNIKLNADRKTDR